MMIAILVAAAKLCEKILRFFGRGATTFPGKLALFFKKEDDGHSRSSYSRKSRNDRDKNSKIISFFQCEHLHL